MRSRVRSIPYALTVIRQAASRRACAPPRQCLSDRSLTHQTSFELRLMLYFLASLWANLSASSLSDQASAATVLSLLVAVVALLLAILGLVVPLLAICFSAWRYISERRETLAREQFQIYHRLIADISRGQDEHGVDHKLVSQLAYIHELRNFPEYGALTRDVLHRLRKEWKTNSPDSTANIPLAAAIEGTVAHLERRKRQWRR